MRKIFGFVSIFLITIGLLKAGPPQQKFDKAAFYEVMKSGDITAIESEILAVKDAPEREKEGYAGALLMKKAGLLKKPKDRLSFFKAGRIKLETAILADNDNTEFHFLRLAIEERAPKIVKYHSDIDKDKVLVVKNFKTLGPSVQHAILDYSKSSKVLHQEDF
jgi:hypothetical protein